MKKKRWYTVTRIMKETASVEATSATDALKIATEDGAAWDLSVVSERSRDTPPRAGRGVADGYNDDDTLSDMR